MPGQKQPWSAEGEVAREIRNRQPRRRIAASRRKAFGEQRYVVAPIAQRRQGQGHDVEAVEEVLAEQAARDLVLEANVGRGQYANVGRVADTSRPPAGTRCSCTKRRSRAWARGVSSATSSMKSVPPSAAAT